MLWYMNSEQLFVSFAFLCALSFISGWIADRIMEYSGFGTYGNWLILLAGCYVGMFGFNSLGYMFHWNPPFTVAFVAGSACTLLLLAAMFKTMMSDLR